MAIRLVQKETTYDVMFEGERYTVTVMEDNVSQGYVQYDVFDGASELVEDEDLEFKIIEYLENNLAE